MKMRELIDLAEQSQPLDEIEIIQALGGSPGQAQRHLGGTVVAQESFGDVYHHPYPQHHQDVYYVGDQNTVFSYVALEDRSGHWWMLEAYTEPQHRGTAMSPQLIRWVVKRLQKVIVDQQLTPIAARMLERMIANGAISASVLDTQTGNYVTYNPNDPTDQAKPIYDEDVPGISRPKVPPAEATRYTWILESRLLRKGILSPYIRRLK
jgi:hypothetical protein